MSLTIDMVPERQKEFHQAMYQLAYRTMRDVRPGGQFYRNSFFLPPDGRPDQPFMLVQWSPYSGQKFPFARVEWNPTKMAGWMDHLEEHVRPFLENGWADAHVTRIDPAVDYPFVNLREALYYASNRKGRVHRNPKDSLHYDKHGIETLYLGSPASNAVLRIYDKAQELRVNEGTHPGYPITRIECQRRSTGLNASEITQLPNPFRRLVLTNPIPLRARYVDKVLIGEAQRVGVDPVLKQLGKRKRKSFKELLDDLTAATMLHPAKVFAADFPTYCSTHFRRFQEDAWH